MELSTLVTDRFLSPSFTNWRAWDTLSSSSHPSPLRPKDAGFPEFLSVDRKKNLLDALEAHPDDRPVYISDNDGDDKLSEEVNFEYVHPLFWTPFYTRLTSDGP